MSQGGPNTPQADPSMDDILASIRRILDDDSQPETETPHTAPGGEDDVFELDHSMMIDEPTLHTEAHPSEPAAVPPPAETPLAAVPVLHAPPALPPEPPVLAPPSEAPEPEKLVAPETQAAASASIGALVRVLGQRNTAVYRGGPTLEDIVRDEIRPLVKNWLDEHLPPIVERMVRAEIERVINHTV